MLVVLAKFVMEVLIKELKVVVKIGVAAKVFEVFDVLFKKALLVVVLEVFIEFVLILEAVKEVEDFEVLAVIDFVILFEIMIVLDVLVFL